MYDTMMTIVGNLVDAPKLRRTKNGHSVANFRMASTPRRFDREQNTWIDGDTLFVSVTCWRSLGENAFHSLQKGQAVVVHGRYYQRDYKQDEMVRTAYELEAVAVGPDLTRGTTTFTRVTRPAGVPDIEVDPEGMPSDQSHRYVDFVDDEPDGEPGAQDAGEYDSASGAERAAASMVDRVTGEVRELASH